MFHLLDGEYSMVMAMAPSKVRLFTLSASSR